MPRTHIHLTDGQLEEIKRRAEKQGLKQSEIVRRVIDKGLEPPLYLGSPLEEPIEFDMPSYKYGGTNERVCQCVDVITRIELFGCKVWAEEKDVKISLTLNGKFKKYTNEKPLVIGDVHPGTMQVWIEFVDKKRYQKDFMGRRIWPNWIHFSGGVKLWQNNKT